MQDAVNIFSKKYPDILCEGEIQFDAAINESVSKKKDAIDLIEDAQSKYAPRLLMKGAF